MMMLRLALTSFAVIAAPALGAPKAECADKCMLIVKTCGDQCTANFPRAKAEGCRKACKASEDKCNEQCRKEK